MFHWMVRETRHRAFHLVHTHLGGGDGVESPIHFYCVLHAKRGEGVQIACKIAYVLNGRPHSLFEICPVINKTVFKKIY